MNIDQIAQLMPLLEKYCQPKIVLINTLIESFADRNWYFRKEFIESMWGGTDIVMIALQSFSLNYYINNIKNIKEYRTTRNKYVSLVYDDYGGVPLCRENFVESRWNAKVAPSGMSASKKQYNALVKLAKNIVQHGAKIVVFQSPVRVDALDESQIAKLNKHWKKLESLQRKGMFVFLNHGMDREYSEDDFVDSTHLSAKGALRFTENVMSELK